MFIDMEDYRKIRETKQDTTLSLLFKVEAFLKTLPETEEQKSLLNDVENHKNRLPSLEKGL